MAEYKFENGKYYRQSEKGDWFEVQRNKDGNLTWTLPNGKKVYDNTFKVPIMMLTANSPIGTMYTIGTGANGSLGHYFSFKDAVNAYTKALDNGAFTDPSENILNDLMVFGPTMGKAVVTGAKALTQVVPKASKAVWDIGKRLVTGQVTKEAAKEATKQATKAVVKQVPVFTTSIAAGYGVNKGSEALTGKSWGENVSKGLTNHWGFRVSPIIGEFTNPGYFLGAPIVKGTLLAIMNQNYSIPFLTNNQTLRKGFGQALNVFGLGNGYLNIRYRNGIRDYLGNVLSKYSTITPKPKQIFSGNHLELARKRVLDNLEKYGIKDTDYVSWTTSIDDPNLIQLSKSIGFEIPSYNKTPYSFPLVTITMPAKTYLEHVSPISGIEASFRPSSATIFHLNRDYIEDILLLYPEFADAHEFSHAIDWVLHNKTTTIPRTSGVDILLNNSHLTELYKLKSQSKINLTKSTPPEVNVPGLNYNRIRLDIGTQEYHRLPTELKARYEQIKNWLGISDERPLTLHEWDLAKRYYTSMVGDNNMLEFFKLVENPKEFINWASKRYNTNYNSTVSLNATIEELPKASSPIAGGSYYPYKVNFDDDLPGFLEMIQQLAKGQAPILKTTGLTSYTMPKPNWQLTPSERPSIFNGLKTTLWRKDPSALTIGDLAYGLAHNLPGWNRSTYSGVLKNTGKWNYDYEEGARAFIYDLKAQFYKRFAKEKGGPLSADEFADALYDLTKKDFQDAIRRVHGGTYIKDFPLAFDVNNLSMNDLNKLINALKEYKEGGKLCKKSIRLNKLY